MISRTRRYGGRVRRVVLPLLVTTLLLVPAQSDARPLELGARQLVGPQADVVTDESARDGRAVSLAGRGSARRRFQARSRSTRFGIRARGVACRGPARMRVVLDGRGVALRTVRSLRFARYRLVLRARPGPHSIRIRLANPLRARSCRRRLVLDTVAFAERGGRTPIGRESPDAPPSPSSPGPSRVEPPSSAVVNLPTLTYRNPVFAAPGAPDPMVLDVGGTHSDYYAFSTGERFPVLRSRDLVHWKPAEPALEERPAWAAQAGDWNPWAPSVIERPGPCPGLAGTRCFVLFHVSLHGTLRPRTNCVGVAVSPTPGGPYTELGPLANADGALDSSGRPPGCGDDAGYSNIDPAPFVDADGTPYLYLSATRTCTSPAPGQECPPGRRISVVALSPDLLTAAGPRQELLAGTDPGWEVAAFAQPVPVVENPNVVKRGDTYFLLYSGGAYTGPYGMGYATASTPVGPFVKAAENPVLREANGVISVGGGALVIGPRGGGWLAYHGRQGSYGAPRELRIDPARFPSPATAAVDGPTSQPQLIAP